jgi:hypothetical protein
MEGPKPSSISEVFDGRKTKFPLVLSYRTIEPIPMKVFRRDKFKLYEFLFEIFFPLIHAEPIWIL